MDLEIIDQVYDAAWAQLEAREPFRDREQDEARREALRKLIYEKVLVNMPEMWTMFERPA